MPHIYWTEEKQSKGRRSKAPRKVLVRVENDQQICTRSSPSSEALVQDGTQARQRHGGQSSRRRGGRARNTCSGKRVPWNPGTEASLRTVQRSKAKRCEAGPVSPCNLGKGTNASLRTGHRSRKGPKKQGQISRQDRPTGDVSKALRWIVATSWSCKGGKKESLKGHLKSCTVQPFPLESTSTVLG